MKKWIALLLTLALCLCAIPAAAAQLVGKDVIDWKESEKIIDEAGLEGEFVELEYVGLKIWIPDTLLPVELSQKDRNNGYIAFFAAEDGSNALGVTLTDAGMTYTDCLALLENSDCEDVAEAKVNGADMITYTVTQEDGTVCRVASMVNENGFVLEFAFMVGDEEFDTVADLIVSSVQPADQD